MAVPDVRVLVDARLAGSSAGNDGPGKPPGAFATSAADALARALRPGTLSIPVLPPLSLYIHLPWCLRKCPYCDFNSHALRADLDETRYLAALRADLEAALPHVWGRRVETVFIGGGTPSLFSPDAIGRLLDDVRALLPLAPRAEVTLEANPGTFERNRFRGYRDAGVTRLSIGVQSFDDGFLTALGRVHDAAQAHAAVDEAASAFDTYNLDLMYALPGQTPDQLRADLRQALAHAPPHLSVYHLTLEPNTWFATHPPPALPDDDTAADMLDAIVDTLGAAGLERYEVSAFARPGHRCRHNLNYWQFGDYLGIGAGAHGKLSYAHRVVRQVRFRDPTSYILNALAGHAVAQDDEVPRKQLPFEFMLNATRLRAGVPLALFMERTGLPPSALQRGIDRAVARGLLVDRLDAVVPTARGYDVLNDLQALFLVD